MTNADLLGYCSQLDVLLTTTGDGKLGIQPSALTKFRDQLREFTDCCNASTASEVTVAVQAAEDERTRLFKGVRAKLVNLQNSANPKVVALMPRVKKYIVDLYGADVSTVSANRRTALIQGLCFDLKKFNATDQTTLGITADLVALEAANQEFLQQSVARSMEAGEAALGHAQQVREALIDAVQVIFSAITYWANNENPDAASADVPAAARQFMDSLNAMTTRVRQGIKIGDGVESANGSGRKPGEGGSGSGSNSGNTSGSGSSTAPSTGGNSGSGSSTGGSTSGSGSSTTPSTGGSTSGSGSSTGGSGSSTGGSGSSSGGSSSGGGRVPDPGSFL